MTRSRFVVRMGDLVLLLSADEADRCWEHGFNLGSNQTPTDSALVDPRAEALHLLTTTDMPEPARLELGAELVRSGIEDGILFTWGSKPLTN